MRWFCFASLPFVFLVLASAHGLCAESPQAEGSWSSKMLNDVFQDPASGTRNQEKAEGLILRSYQLRKLRVGESGRAKSTLLLLEKLLPSGSTLKVDVPSNSLHLLATPSAHAAAWDFISTVEAEETQSAPPSPSIPEELRETLAKLGRSLPPGEISQRMEEVKTELRELDERSRSRQDASQLLLGAILLLLGCLALFLLRRKKHATTDEASAAPASVTLLAPENISSALEPMHRQLQQDMLGALNAAAIRMEAWYNEQKTQRNELLILSQNQESRLEQLRERIIEENRALLAQGGTQFQASATRIEEGVNRLSEQNDKIGALAVELERTLRELDASKDQVIKLQTEMEGRGAQLDQARQVLSQREGDLARQQAKLAALSLILEKGAGLPELRFDAPIAPLSGGAQPSPGSPEAVAAAGLRFEFLPP